MADAILLKTDKKPSLLNKEMLIGGLLGLAAGLFIPAAAGAIWVFGGAAAAAVTGGLIGGALGKERMKKESANGKVVDGQKSFLSKETAIGSLIGLGVGIAAAITTLIFAGDLSIASAADALPGPLIKSGIAAAGQTTMLAIGTIAALAVPPVLGTLIGAKHGQKIQEKEYETAKGQHIGRHIGSVTSPEIGKAVEYAMTHNKSWAKDALEEKLLAATQQTTRV